MHTPMITQLMCVEFMKKYDIDKYIEKNRALYGKKCKVMLDTMEETFPRRARWSGRFPRAAYSSGAPARE